MYLFQRSAGFGDEHRVHRSMHIQVWGSSAYSAPVPEVIGVFCEWGSVYLLAGDRKVGSVWGSKYLF